MKKQRGEGHIMVSKLELGLSWLSLGSGPYSQRTGSPPLVHGPLAHQPSQPNRNKAGGGIRVWWELLEDPPFRVFVLCLRSLQPGCMSWNRKCPFGPRVWASLRELAKRLHKVMTNKSSDLERMDSDVRQFARDVLSICNQDRKCTTQ